ACASRPAHPPARAGTEDCTADDAGEQAAGKHRADAWDETCGDRSKNAAPAGARNGAGGGTVHPMSAGGPGFGMPVAIAHGKPDLIFPEPGASQFVNCLLGPGSTFERTHCRRTMSHSHDKMAPFSVFDRKTERASGREFMVGLRRLLRDKPRPRQAYRAI